MRTDVKYVHSKILAAGGLNQIEKAIDLTLDHLAKVHKTADGQVFTAKNKRLSQWNPDRDEVYWLIVKMFTMTMTQDYVTYQALAGGHSDTIPMDSVPDRVKTVSEVIAMMCLADVINIHTTLSNQHLIKPVVTLMNIPVTDKHGTVYHRPQTVESNHDPEQGSMLLGGKLNAHDGDICLDHINRMNSVPMALNVDFLRSTKEESKKDLDTEEKRRNWEQYYTESTRRNALACVESEKLYLNHKPDTRGRIYSTGYYIDTQGSSYKKASIELYHKEKLI